MTVRDIIIECRDLISKYTNNFLLKDIRTRYYKECPDTYNDIWIRNYCIQFVIDLLEHIDEYEIIYAAFGDVYSCETFREICIKRFLYIISMDDKFNYSYYLRENDFQALLKNVNQKYLLWKGNTGEKIDKFLWKGYHIISETKNIAAFELDQYSYGDIVRVCDRSVVLDCGASQGEEIIYFLSIAKGLFFHSFTLEAQEIMRYHENMKQNNIVDYRISQNALWNISGKTVSFTEDGSRSMVTKGGESLIQTITLNDYVMSLSSQGPFFVKMDIEGAEVKALTASDIILSLPETQAAISVYHKPEDIRKVGKQLLKYRDTLYLKQCKSNLSETMMYIAAKEMIVGN